MEENRRVVIVISDMLDPTNDMVKEKFEWIWTEKIAEPDNNLAKSFIRYSYSILCNLYTNKFLCWNKIEIFKENW